MSKKDIAKILQGIDGDADLVEAIETLTHALADHVADAAIERGKGRGIPHFQHVDALVPEVSSALRKCVSEIVDDLLESDWYNAEGDPS